MSEQEERVQRLVNAIYKLSKWSGTDVSELIEEGYLNEGDV